MDTSRNGTEPAEPTIIKSRGTEPVNPGPSATAFTSDTGTMSFAPTRKIWPSENRFPGCGEVYW